MEKLTNITDQDWFKALIEEGIALLSEKKFQIQMELIEMKWELGDLILKEEENFKRFGYGERIVEILAPILGMSESHLWKVIQFRKKFKSFDEVMGLDPDRKTLSWFRIYTEFLPKHKDEKIKDSNCKHLKVKCVKCGKEFLLKSLLKK